MTCRIGGRKNGRFENHVKSTIGAVPKHRKTVAALGLRKLNKTVVLPDNAATRGMVRQVRHLVKVEEA